jgi:hypothetical protein
VRHHFGERGRRNAPLSLGSGVDTFPSLTIEEVSYRRRRDDVLEGPAARGHETPKEVLRVPVATGGGKEEILLPLVIDDHRIGAGTIGDPLVQLLEVVLVVDVDGITVCVDAG